MTQEVALEILKTGAPVFLTGSAGTGKTYVLNQYIGFLKQMGISYAVTASTGIAATHIGGTTIHSWSGIGIRKELSAYDIDVIMEKQYLYKRLSKTEVLIIDEISMLPSSTLDMLHVLLSTIRNDNRPFGGIQIIFCGDFFQLPPVLKNKEITVSDFAFSAQVWKALDPVICYLTTQYRQSGADLIDILDTIRQGDTDNEIFSLLSERHGLTHQLPYTRLYTHNIDVDTENLLELSKLDTLEKVYEMTSRGKEVLVNSLIKNCLANQELKLRVGARVMFVKNMPEMGYMNGTLGEVVGFGQGGYPLVEISDGRVILVEPVDWELEEDGKVRASITQIPLRLAWAITIHKSQGMSLDRAEIDLSKSFTFGQGYVALSRLRTLEGIVLSGFSNQALLIHPDVLAYDQVLKRHSELAEQAFLELREELQLKKQKEFVVRSHGVWSEHKSTSGNDKKLSLSTYDQTKKILEEEKSFRRVCEIRGLTLGTILKHCEVLKELNMLPDLSLFEEIDIERINTIIPVFLDLKTDKLTPVLEYLQKADFPVTYDELRIARLFVL